LDDDASKKARTASEKGMDIQYLHSWRVPLMPVELIHVSLGITFLLVWGLIVEILWRNHQATHGSSTTDAPPQRVRKRRVKTIRSDSRLHS